MQRLAKIKPSLPTIIGQEYSGCKEPKLNSSYINPIEEESKSEREKQVILTHVYGVLKNGTDEPICLVRIET